MAFQGITFDGQNVTPKNDGALYVALYGDGILDGCTMTISGDDLVIASGHFIAGGRVCQVDGATSVDLSGRTLTTGYIQVIMNYDLTQDEGSQWYTSFVESATTTFPDLTQEDINETGTLYQVQLAVVQISGGSITNITSSMLLSPLSPKRTLFPCDLVVDRGADADGYAYFYQNGIAKARVGYRADNLFNCGTCDSVGNSLGGLIVPPNTDQYLKLFANNQDIHFLPKGVSNYDVDYAIGKDSGMLVCNNASAYFGGLLRRRSGADIAYLRITGSGYLDIWSTNVTQIRVGAGNQENDNVRFMFNSNGVLTAKGMYTTTRSGSTLVIDSSGNIGRTSSLRKYKKNIEDVTEEQANKGYELRPITYESAIEDDIKERQYGFIAEEVEKVVPELCTYSLEGEIDGVAYERVCALLMKQNQMLKARVDALEERVAKLEKEIGK